MKQEHFFFRCCFLFFSIFLMSSSVFGQACSFNTGGDIFICNDVESFMLLGEGSDDVENIIWSMDSASQGVFDLMDPSNPMSPVSVLANPAPPGTYVFTLTATCDNGEVISGIIDVVISEPLTQAVITNNTNDPDASILTVCNMVSLSGGELADGEIGSWTTNANPNLITWSDLSNNTLDLEVVNRGYLNCISTTFSFQYTVKNGGCETTDEITITFRGEDPDISLSIRAGEAVCGSLITFEGSNLGCGSSINDFSLAYVGPNLGANTPVQVGDNRIFLERTEIDYQFYVSGEYTFTYTIQPSESCDGGTITRTFFICIAPNVEVPEDISILFCDGLPSSFVYEIPPINPNFMPEPWTISYPNNSSGYPIPEINNDVPNQVSVSNIDPNIPYLEIRQTVVTSICMDVNPDDPTDVVEYECSYTQYITLYNRLIIEIETENVDFFCGAALNFNPLDYVRVSADERVVKLIDAPNPEDITTFSSFPINEDLLDQGKYVFEISALRFDEFGQSCLAVETFCVNVCDPGIPTEPTVSEVCVGLEQDLVGSSPNDDCANINWEYISGPAFDFVNGTSQNDQIPTIIAYSTGDLCMEYSYSQSDDCYLAVEFCFPIVDCDGGPCDSICPTPEYRCDTDEFGFDGISLYLDGIRQASGATYQVCPESAKWFPESAAGTTVTFEVCPFGIECDTDDPCCWIFEDFPLPESCCDSEQPPVGFKCEPGDGFYLLIEGVDQASGATHHICPDIAWLPLSAAGTEVTFEVCEFGSTCGQNDDCCWTYTETVPELCCVGEQPSAGFVCKPDGYYLQLDGVEQASGATHHICPDIAWLPLNAEGRQITFEVCEFGSSCGENGNCCWTYTETIPACEEPCLVELSFRCNGTQACLFINGIPANEQTSHYDIDGGPLCVDPSLAGTSVSYRVTQRNNKSCVASSNFIVPDCKNECINELSMRCDENGACLYINGVPASMQTNNFRIDGDSKCLDASAAGKFVRYTVTQINDPDCRVTARFIVPSCESECTTELTLECVGDKRCLFINGTLASSQSNDYVIQGNKICLDEETRGNRAYYMVKMKEDPDCMVQYRFMIPDCREGEGQFRSTELDGGNSDLADITIYPNPILDKLYIDNPMPGKIDYQILNADGKVLLRGTLKDFGEDVLLLNQLSSGVYFIRLQEGHEGDVRIEKFFKQ